MATSLQPRAPKGLGGAGRRLWKRLVTEQQEVVYRPDELLLIEEASMVADVLSALRDGPQDPKVITEIRLQQEALRKLLRSVHIPEDDDDDTKGHRSSAARALAQARWAH